VIRISQKSLNYSELIDPAVIARIYKDEDEGHHCYFSCECDPDTIIELKDGTKLVVDESINTLEARITRHLTGSPRVSQ
jgi:hypothetical protein